MVPVPNPLICVTFVAQLESMKMKAPNWHSPGLYGNTNTLRLAEVEGAPSPDTHCTADAWHAEGCCASSGDCLYIVLVTISILIRGMVRTERPTTPSHFHGTKGIIIETQARVRLGYKMKRLLSPSTVRPQAKDQRWHPDHYDKEMCLPSQALEPPLAPANPHDSKFHTLPNTLAHTSILWCQCSAVCTFRHAFLLFHFAVIHLFFAFFSL